MKKNKIYDLAAPIIKSFSEIYDVILKHQNKKRLYLPVPFLLLKYLLFFYEKFPQPLITRDQVNLLKYDSVSDIGLANLKKVVKTPASMETIIKNYL